MGARGTEEEQEGGDRRRMVERVGRCGPSRTDRVERAALQERGGGGGGLPGQGGGLLGEGLDRLLDGRGRRGAVG